MKKQAMAETAEQLLVGKGWLPTLLQTQAPVQPEQRQAQQADPYPVAAE